MKLHSIILLFTVISILASCKQNNQKRDCINLNQDKHLSVFDVFSKVDAIQLETSPESILSSIGKVVDHNNRFYILDSSRQRVLSFSGDGQFLFQVSKQGNGKGEYNWISDIAIDRQNNQLIIVDNKVQRIHYFNLDGGFLRTITIQSDVSLGLNRAIPIQDSLLLLVGLYQNDFILFCLKEESILERFGGLKDYPVAFMAIYSAYPFGESAHVLQPLDNTVYKVSRNGFTSHRKWCFGKADNTTSQIESLKANFYDWQVSRISPPINYIVEKHLNSYINFVWENEAFAYVQVEFNNQTKNVFKNKVTDKHYVFDIFNEGIQIDPTGFGENGLICIYESQDYSSILKSIIEEGKFTLAFSSDISHQPYYEDYYYNRNHTFYTREILTERGKQVYDNHDPMTDNPYLVIFKFKE